MRKLLLAASVLLFSTAAYSQCTTWQQPTPTTGWTNFNNQFGGAPCTATPPTTFEITGFEIWAAEAYSMANIKQGGSYTFSACNGPGAGSWTPVFTILNPTGGVVAFGRNAGSTCALTFTAPVTGTYLIVINQSGALNCGGGPNTMTDNGFPAITYNGGASCDPPITTCEAGTYVGAANQSLCPGATGTVSASGVIVPNTPTVGTRVVIFTPGATGSGGLGGRFFLTGVQFPYTFDNDLNGVLSFNGFPPLLGNWTVRPGVSSNAAAAVTSLCDTTAAASQVTFLNSGASGCAPFVCEAGDVTASNQSVCPGDDWSLTITGETLPVPGQVYWFFLDTNDVSGNNDYIYNLGTDPTFYNFVGDFNALLAASMLDTLTPSTYLTFAGIFNPADTTICDVTDNAFFITVNAPTSVACGGTVPCQLPYPVVTGLSTTPLANGIRLNWNPIPGSLGCQIQGGLASGGPLQLFQVIQPNLSQFFVPQGQLTPGQSYRWRVRCGCSFTIAGAYSPYNVFTWNPGGEPPMRISNTDIEYVDILSKDNAPTEAFRNVLNTSGIFGNNVYEGRVQTAVRKAELRNYYMNNEVTGTAGVSNLSVFPNPSNGEVNINLRAQSEGSVQVRIYDAIGKLVFATNFNVISGSNFTTMDLSAFDAGMYMVEIIDNGNRSSERIILTK